MGWTYAFSKPCEPESFHESYSSGASPDKISTLQLLRRREVNERLCIEEVGVDLELCVHAHGHDVDPIMETSCNNKYFLDKYPLVAVNWSFATMVPTMFVLLWFYFSDKLNYLPSADQYAFPTSILLYLRVLPPGISWISTHCNSSMKFWRSSTFSHHSHSTGSGLSSTENTNWWIESILRFITLSTLLLRSLILHHVTPSLIGYIIIMLNLNCATWSLISEHNFRWWVKLTSSFLVLSILLEQQTWFQVCVVPLVPITFRFTIHLTRCHHRSITSWNLSTNVSWSSSTFWALPR